MKKYLLIQPDEEGNPIRWIPKEELKDIKQFMEEYGIESFLEKLPNDEPDPNYWKEGTAMLLEVEIKKVKAVKVATQYIIE